MLIGKAKEWVAPYVGAWIETFPTFNVFRPAAVAPYVGAWIETNSFSGNLTKDMSHPTWVRGLKLKYRILKRSISVSHPTWVRGLKQFIVRNCSEVIHVAPYVGAWIETPH